MTRLRHRDHRGMVLILTIVVMAIMSLAAVGLMRSVASGNRVAGNIAFQESAVQAADLGLERAVAWLEQAHHATGPGNVRLNSLHNTVDFGSAPPVAYYAVRQDPAANQTWQAFFDVLGANTTTLPGDFAGNRVRFVVHRLCAKVGAPSRADCTADPTPGFEKTFGANPTPIPKPTQTYYRITVLVQGARNATSIVQSVVAL